MTDKPQSCVSCIHSHWRLTPTGKIKRDTAGRCTATFEKPNLPACIAATYHRHYVWKENGENCPLFELNTTGLKQDINKLETKGP